MAAYASAGKGNHKASASRGSAKSNEESPSQSREIITPSIVELTKEVRTNILCTVESCGKILPNTPALNMHLVKSHRVKEGLVNPTIRKELTASKKLYSCPIEGCPRGPNRPFSQFSLVKQHFMKMHAEKKHKCSKCNNGYSTEWDLRRHTEDCGKTYRCTCGCPYASRAALLSHIYRTGHELPTEHRIPPVKKRKMEKLISSSVKVRQNESTCQNLSANKELSVGCFSAETNSHAPDTPNPTSYLQRSHKKMLLPKPKMALVNFPVMQLTHLPVLVPSTESGALRSVVLTMDCKGSLSALQLLPQAMGAMVPHLDSKALGFKESFLSSRSSLGPISTGVQVSLEPLYSQDPASGLGGLHGRSTSTNIQTDISCLSRMPLGAGVGVGMGVCVVGDPPVSSCAQTDISVSAEVLLPVSVETQTFPSTKAKSTIAAQTDGLCLSQIPCSGLLVSAPTSRQTQTGCPSAVSQSRDRVQVDQAVMCSDLFASDFLSVSTQTSLALEQSAAAGVGSLYEDVKSAGPMCFGVQTDDLNSNSMSDNQTQTMTFLHDLENMLSDSMSGHQVLEDNTAGCGPGLDSVQDQHTGIDFDFEEFLNTVHIQTQTEESELRGLGSDTPLESLDIQTQTDFLLLEELEQSTGHSRTQATDLELEMFDTHTQTDLNFLLSAGNRMPLGSILGHSSFSMSTESSDTETQTDVPPPPLGLSPQLPVPHTEQGRLLSSTETQTSTCQVDGLSHLFLTSNETQTVMDDFLSADLAWNMESHFSSVETQTCESLWALLRHPDKPNS
ncbi:ATM interactor isoform X1 [Gadus macrocephalus]|uniref:ATM interactor isoform X1 n=2 Tax=Gadus macrocephalus TaxID=80720 RepID=UPI0028CB3523|nr:ATM interactor isoform X1 [Gadus macrocephalus]